MMAKFQDSCNRRECQTGHVIRAVSFWRRSRYNAAVRFEAPDDYAHAEGSPMIPSSLRLGDVIDDYCPRCKLLLNHAVASMVGGTVVKVVCQTCHSEHPYKNAEVPPKKKAGPKAALLDQVLAKAAPASADPPSPDRSAKSDEAAESPRKKRGSSPARYITRHATRPPRGKV